MSNGDKVAFPIPDNEKRNKYRKYGSSTDKIDGLSKRERFAMAAMQGILAGDVNKDNQFKEVSIHAVDFADALLKELEQTND